MTLATEMEQLQSLIQLVKQNRYHVPRDYDTVGGMWTVDTYKRRGVTVKEMDEGFSTSVSGEGLLVWVLYNPQTGQDYIEYKLGDSRVVENLTLNLSTDQLIPTL